MQEVSQNAIWQNAGILPCYYRSTIMSELGLFEMFKKTSIPLIRETLRRSPNNLILQLVFDFWYILSKCVLFSVS